MNIKFFKSPIECRRWLERNHDKVTELWFGFYKKNSGKHGITYREALDEALCFGWIDGLKKSVDEDSYTYRFTPRKTNSIWSVINTKRAKELRKLGRMAAPGLKAFEARDPKRSAIYSFENRPRKLSPDLEKRFKVNQGAWEFFVKTPPGYQRLMRFWVMGAKKEETRLNRLASLIEASEKKTKIGLGTGKSGQQQ
jgi:uncharacterized protein YdeI (YjbR/CyaY-like superfamily)